MENQIKRLEALLFLVQEYPEFEDAFCDVILQSPVRSRLVDIIKYQSSTPPSYLVSSLAELEDDGDISALVRSLHQADIDIKYLTIQLADYASTVKKYDKLAVKVDFLRRQNKRLLQRNNELLSMSKGKPKVKVKVGKFGKN